MAYNGGYANGYSDIGPAPPIITATANNPRWHIAPTSRRFNAQPNQRAQPQGSQA